MHGKRRKCVRCESVFLSVNILSPSQNHANSAAEPWQRVLTREPRTHIHSKIVEGIVVLPFEEVGVTWGVNRHRH